MKAALEAMSSVLNMGVQNIAHIQFPIPQSNTTAHAQTKHKRTIEDYLLSASCISQNVGLLLVKPGDAHASDKRGCLQQCVAVSIDAKNPPWTPPLLVGPLELIRVSDMLGYDEMNRPGATARAEQTLGRCSFFGVFPETEWYFFALFQKHFVQLFVPRKGVPVHIEIIEAYVKTLDLKEEDKVIVFDILSNRRGWQNWRRHDHGAGCIKFTCHH